MKRSRLKRGSKVRKRRTKSIEILYEIDGKVYTWGAAMKRPIIKRKIEIGDYPAFEAIVDWKKGTYVSVMFEEQKGKVVTK